MERRSVDSILIIKPSSLGDIVHALPAVAAIRDSFPTARISWAINPEWAPLLAGSPDIDEVLLFPRQTFRGWGAIPNIIRWAGKMRKMRPDVALDFQGLLRSALIGRVSHPKRLLGLGDAREGARFFYGARAPVTSGMHAVDRYLELAKLLGASVNRPLRFTLPQGEPLADFDGQEPYLLLHPFSRGAGKSLTPEAISQLCHRLAPLRIVLAGRQAEAFHAPENCLNLLNKTSLLQLIWLLRRARCIVSVDSGPMHIAAALSDRLLSIHTWSDPKLVGPYNQEAWIWKAGQALQVKNIPLDFAADGARPFACGDVDTIITVVRQLWS